MKTLLIMPAYNEENNITKTLSDLTAEGLAIDMLVVVDGSNDRTYELASLFPVYILNHPYNMGYGAALQSGYKFAKLYGYTHVLQFDADGQHNPCDLKTLINAFQNQDVDVVLGSRFIGDRHFQLGIGKMTAIRFFRLLIRMITGKSITDPTSGLRGLSMKVFRYFSYSDRFPSDYPDADILIQILLMGGRVMEVPVGNRNRTEGKSMHSGLRPMIYLVKVGLSILVVTMSYILYGREKPFRE